MQVPMGVRNLTDLPGSISLRKGTYLWRLEAGFHNTVSYTVRLNHGGTGASGSFKFIAFDDRRTPGLPDIMRLESGLMTKNAGQTSEWIFNNYQGTVFL